MIKLENCVKNENQEFSATSHSNNTLEENTFSRHVSKIHKELVTIKFEATFNCTVCREEILDENVYNKHMTMHLNETCNADIGNIKLEHTEVCPQTTDHSTSFSSSVNNTPIKLKRLRHRPTVTPVPRSSQSRGRSRFTKPGTEQILQEGECSGVPRYGQPTPPPKKPRASTKSRISRKPITSSNPSEGSLPVEPKSKGVKKMSSVSRLGKTKQSSIPISFQTLVRAEAMDLSEEEIEDPLCLKTMASPVFTDFAMPSTSGTSYGPCPLQASYGSDLDSDFDDEFDNPHAPITTTFDREIPENKELPEGVRNEVTHLQRVMDEEIEQVAGSRPSFHWEEDFSTYRGAREIFTGPTPGPVRDYDTAYDAFVEIWSNDIIGHIVTETNRYAKQSIDEKIEKGELKAQSRLRRWVGTDIDEIYMLLALHILMGIDVRTSHHEYWQKDSWISMERFRKLMSYDRFVMLNTFYHFIDNSKISSSDSRQNPETGSEKLRKLIPIIDHLNHKFSTLYNLHPEICIDESLTLFKGRLPWIQAIRSKAARFGIKSFEICESHTGYMSKFKIYMRKDSNPSSETIVTDLGVESVQAVLNLLKGLENLGHLVTMDNYYNSPALARLLKSKGFDCLGTLRSNRKDVPEAIKNIPNNAPVGNMEWRHSGDICTVAWKDVSKVVRVISTCHDNETYIGARAGKSLEKARCVGDYIRIMGGVELIDEKLSQYIERKRGLKWYLKMFKRLLNVSIHNAYIMHIKSLKRRNLPFMTHREFRKGLANEIIARHRNLPLPVAALIPNVPDEDTRLRGDIVHSPNYIPGRQHRKRCVICYQLGINKMVHLKCMTCQVSLCIGNCWNEWHTLTTLKSNKCRTWPLYLK